MLTQVIPQKCLTQLSKQTYDLFENAAIFYISCGELHSVIYIQRLLSPICCLSFSW